MTAPATPFMTVRRHLTSFLCAAACAAAASVAAPAAFAEDLIVKFDQSEILRLPRAAAEIIVGNPTIAEVTIQSSNILVVTGKSFGITNFIALDAERNVIQDQRVSVRRDEVGVVNLTKGIDRQTFACLPQCNPTVTVGDDQKFMQQTLSAAQVKKNFSENASSETGGQQAGN